MRMRLFAVAALSAVTVVAGTSALYAPAYAQGPTKSVWDGVYTADQADKGKALFQENCSKCHGVTLDGNDEIPALASAHLMVDFDGQTVGDLVQRIQTTMPMDNPGSLNAQTVADIASFILKSNNMPAGSTEIKKVALRVYSK